ncbi:helix-turn-helix domain-containing protein [Streptomyces celluloflavus]|uniref:Helix-turn-helix domain-containing protein n=1 Tax=Streptomyces celluloflavus TaxID=58344 RepID=A0ABW7RQ20_9ACTN
MPLPQCRVKANHRFGAIWCDAPEVLRVNYCPVGMSHAAFRCGDHAVRSRARRVGAPGRVAGPARGSEGPDHLACADGLSNMAVARIVGVQTKTVGKWRRAFAAERMAGLEGAGWIGRPKADLVLGEAERSQLTQWARRAKTAQFLALRAKIVLRCAEGGTNQQAAADLGIDRSTVDRRRAACGADRGCAASW